MFKKNNNVTLIGVIEGVYLHHEGYGEKFYSICLEVPRYSAATDHLNCIVSDRVINVNDIISALDSPDNVIQVKITGDYRTFRTSEVKESTKEPGKYYTKYHTEYYVFVDTIEFLFNSENVKLTNDICLSGVIVKDPVYRTTPNGREITDIIIKVDRSYGKVDYIPLVVWGKNSKYASNLYVGTEIEVKGRLQSRLYQKIVNKETGEKEVKTAYDVSISMIKEIGSSMSNDTNNVEISEE